jgi:hypothetical protein
MNRGQYDDGLDDDGYPIEVTPQLRYRHGSEAEAGDWQPTQLAATTSGILERAGHTLVLSPHCDSPIEAQIGAALIMFFERAKLPLKLCKMVDLRSAPQGLLLVPQFAWWHYRTDWAILNANRSWTRLIECDGRDFHTSKEQIAHDNAKDCAAAQRGYRTVRFTGSKIHRDPDGCAQHVFDMVCSL